MRCYIVPFIVALNQIKERLNGEKYEKHNRLQLYGSNDKGYQRVH